MRGLFFSLRSCTLRFHSTAAMIRVIEKGRFPERAMLTFHTQRWTDNPAAWLKEFTLQNVKNGVKWVMVDGRWLMVKKKCWLLTGETEGRKRKKEKIINLWLMIEAMLPRKKRGMRANYKL